MSPFPSSENLIAIYSDIDPKYRQRLLDIGETTYSYRGRNLYNPVYFIRNMLRNAKISTEDKDEAQHALLYHYIIKPDDDAFFETFKENYSKKPLSKEEPDAHEKEIFKSLFVRDTPRPKKTDSVEDPDERFESNSDQQSTESPPPKKTPQEIQQRIDDLFTTMELSPDKWKLDFSEFDNEGKEMLFDKLVSFMESVVGNLAITNKYKFKFRVNNCWYSKPLTPELWNTLLEKLKNGSLIYDIDNKPPEYFYEKGGENIPEWSLFDSIGITRTVERPGARQSNKGSFFQHLCTLPDLDLTRYQIFSSLTKDNKMRSELKDCCFIYALKQTELFSKDVLNKMRMRINLRTQHQNDLDIICKEFNIKLVVKDINPSLKSTKKSRKARNRANGESHNYLGSENGTEVKMVLFDGHYFLHERTKYSAHFINHIEDFISESNRLDLSKIDIKTGGQDRRYIMSDKLVRVLMDKGYFKPITYSEFSIMKTVFYDDLKVKKIDRLEYNEEMCTRLIEQIKEKRYSKSNEHKSSPTFWYADFEADVTSKVHTPYMCCIHSLSGNIRKEFRGIDSGKDLLTYLPDNAYIYFHNLAYDIRFVANLGIKSSVIHGTKVYNSDIQYKGKLLHFRDTLPILSCKLSALPKMFHIDGVQKEIFPYKYYTLERLKLGVGVIRDAGQNEDKPWNEDDYKLFEHNIDQIGCRIDGANFDMWKYCSFYCNQDVNILRIAFNKFCKGFIRDFKINPFDFASISSLANEVFNQRVYYPNGNLYKVGGHVRKFMSQAIYGGRCMCALNKKWKVKGPISDYDAVSLYPSAMSRLYTVEGKPTVIDVPPNWTNLTEIPSELNNASAYVIDIKITKVDKHFQFPLIVQKTAEGLNLNDDTGIDDSHPVCMTVDNIYLEDLVEFQHITFDIIRGYKWMGKKDYRIQDEIRRIFNMRLKYKAEGNPLEQLYKLIMNSCYGKTIQRPIDKGYKYKLAGEEVDKYWQNNYNSIIEDIEIPNSSIHALRVIKPIDNHFNFSLLGIQVLSMSKRIMNEVMCLANDLGCRIYYQDTDSMHIMTEDLPKLEEAFKQKYGRELRGKNLGQFHSDFPTINGHNEIPISTDSIFLMKKMYIDKLTDSTGDIDYMIRGKGLTQNSISAVYNKHYNGDPMKLYEDLYNGNEVTFDLTEGQPCFKMNKNLTVSTLMEFRRKIKTNYSEGAALPLGRAAEGSDSCTANADSI